LDESLVYSDAGVSAYRGKNREVGALADLLDLIRKGHIKGGEKNEAGESETVLLIENLDRLSRDYARKAFRVLEDIVDQGVDVVTLTDGKRYTEEALNSDPMTLFGALFIMARANEESVQKGLRVASAKEAKRKRIFGGSGERFTSGCPAWLEPNKDGNGFQVIEDKAEVVRQIFRWYLDGDGFGKILERLHKAGIPSLGKGTRWGQTSLVRLISGVQVYGAIRFKDGSVVEGYYPEIIRKGDWERANAIRLAKPGNRKMASGPTGFCLARLLVCADCGGRVGRKNKTKGMTYLICENRACGFRTKTEPVVDAIKEVLSRNVLTRSDPIPPLESAGEALAEAVGASERRIADLSTRSERLADAVADGSQEAKKSLLATERAREEERLKLFNLVALLASLEPKLFEERKLALRAAIRDGDDVALNRILSQMVFRIELGESKATIHWKHSNEVTEVPFTYRNPKKRKTVPA
jgi:DNA invertase Pin-like site-specific DNA recombinase